VGAVYGVASSPAAPPVTPSPTASPFNITSPVPASTMQEIFTLTLAPTDTPAPSPSATPTHSLTPTATQTAPLSSTPCIPWSSWPAYIVQLGDTLSLLARATGSSVPELMQANCLPDDLIYVGQWLYVPRVPVKSLTATPSVTLTQILTVTTTVTPTFTPTNTLTNTPSATATDTPYLLFQQR
jgi:LysM repeat protein